MKAKHWVCLALASLAPTIVSASTVYDSFNIGLPLQDNQNGDNCCVNADTDLGWFYTPSQSYTLTGIETIFDNLSESDPTVTFGVFTDLPSNGGVLLGSATYTPAGGTLGGQSGLVAAPTFTGIPLTSGTTYFVGLENIFHLGVNQVTFESTGVEGTPPGSVSPGLAWGDTDNSASFSVSNCSDPNNWFCKPEIEFLGPSPTSTPEPASLLLMLAAAAALKFVHRRY